MFNLSFYWSLILIFNFIYLIIWFYVNNIVFIIKIYVVSPLVFDYACSYLTISIHSYFLIYFTNRSLIISYSCITIQKISPLSFFIIHLLSSHITQYSSLNYSYLNLIQNYIYSISCTILTPSLTFILNLLFYSTIFHSMLHILISYYSPYLITILISSSISRISPSITFSPLTFLCFILLNPSSIS